MKRQPKRQAASSQRGLSDYEPPELGVARAKWRLGHYPEALKLFEAAARRSPRNPRALADAARAFGARFEFDHAEEYLERLKTLASPGSGILELVGQSYRMIRRPEQALEDFEQALETPRVASTVHLEMAMLYERRNDLSSARHHVEAWEAQVGKTPEGQLLAGRLARRRKDSSQAESSLIEVTTSSGANPVTRVQAWHELALLNDEQEEYPLAIAALAKAKSILKPLARPHEDQAQREQREIDSLFADLRTSDFESWFAAPVVDEAAHGQTWLTGLPRSGTTLLERLLDAHPQVVTSDEMEAFPKFIFPALLQKSSPDPVTVQDLHRIPRERLTTEQHRYMRYLQGAGNVTFEGRVHIDKNPSIIPLIPGMVRLFPNSRLIIALRDPRDLVLSCYMRYLPLNSVSAQFLTIRKAAARFERDMELWFRLKSWLPPERWVEVRYEETVENLPEVATRVTRFLGLPMSPDMLNYHRHSRDKVVNSPTYEDVQKPLYATSKGRWTHYEMLLEPVLDRLTAYLKPLGY